MARLEELRNVARRLERLGANLTLNGPDSESVAIGARPAAATVTFRTRAALGTLAPIDPLGLAEAFLDGAIDVSGDWLEVMKVTDLVEMGPTRMEKLGFALQLLLRRRRRLQRDSIAFHYDRAAEFFLPWLDRWRSYSHGFYASCEESVDQAQTRKLEFALDALRLGPGMHAFDMGCGWGSFLEFAGTRGVSVQGITISREQHRFVSDVIRKQELPCEVELVDFLDFTPNRKFDAATFMGTMEHMTDYRRVARFLAGHLEPHGRVYMDFCSARGGRQVGAFLGRYVWPGTSTYVDLPRVVGELHRAGFDIVELKDDTQSYAWTLRDWAAAFEGCRAKLVERWGEREVRVFQLFLHSSHYFLARRKTQAYHLVAGRG